MKLQKDLKWEWDQPFYWVAHPESGEDELSKRRYDMEIIGGIVDAEASYSYDDWALVELDKNFYLFSTSGCSCPSPSETCRLEIGPATLDQIEEHVKSENYEGYTVPKRQLDEFLELINKARELYK